SGRDLAPWPLHRDAQAVLRAVHVGPQPGPLSRSVPGRGGAGEPGWHRRRTQPDRPTAVGLRRTGGRRAFMDTLIDSQEERVVAALKRLRLLHLGETLNAVLSEAAKEQWTYGEFLDRILSRELDAKQGKRVRMALQIAHFPCVRTIEEFDFSFQPSVDERLVR